MAKDPALMFYPKDFLSRVMLLNDADVGRYIRIICLQFINGHLDEATVTNIIPKFSKVWTLLNLDNEGLYYDPDTEDAILKRKAYCESRRQNANKRYSDEKTDVHMQSYANANVNENVNVNLNLNNLSILLKKVDKDLKSYIKAQPVKHSSFNVDEAFDQAIKNSYGG